MAINNEKQFKKWLKEQMVEGERRFTDNSISAYLSAIRSAESKLSVASVFSCRTLSEFDALDSTIRNHPEFDEFNAARGNGALSAGLRAYREFLTSDIATETRIQKAWFVGATGHDDDGRWTDFSETYLADGRWMNGYFDRFLDDFRSMNVGDKIVLKSTSKQKRNLPFENNGKEVGFVVIKAIGEITYNAGDGRNVTVAWQRVDPIKRWYSFCGFLRNTIFLVDGTNDGIKQALLDFVFCDKPQDYSLCEAKYADEVYEQEGSESFVVEEDVEDTVEILAPEVPALDFDALVEELKVWYATKPVRNNVSSSLIAFAFKYAESLASQKVSSQKLVDAVGLPTMFPYIDRGKDLYFAIKDNSFGFSFANGEESMEASTLSPVFTDFYRKTDVAPKEKRNRIYFGAPGTGKSYQLRHDVDNLLGCGGGYERVTFYADYSYAQFFGAYKPIPDGNGITYAFVPGPFTRIWVKAMKSAASHDPKPFVLVIEEINRADPASVFGDVFQLLDRDQTGISEFGIQIPDEVRAYIEKELGYCPEELELPDNMFIWATMNSADQGVFVMDTAFKRRWDFLYRGIDEGEDKVNGTPILLGKGDHARVVKWNDLRKAINTQLLSCGINEDKLMGPFFIKTDDESFAEEFASVFKNKVLMYLYEDAAKQKRSHIFDGYQGSKSYSALCKEFDAKGVSVFTAAIRSQFTELPDASGDEE